MVSVLKKKDQGQRHHLANEIEAEYHQRIPLIMVLLQVNDAIKVEDLEKVEAEAIGVRD